MAFTIDKKWVDKNFEYIILAAVALVALYHYLKKNNPDLLKGFAIGGTADQRPQAVA